MDEVIEQSAVAVNEFVTVPETLLPNGTVVPEFKVGKYITGRDNGVLVITAAATPWTEINFHDAKAEAIKAGMKLITETQYLAIALNISKQPINWTGGEVDVGALFQGIRWDNVEEAQPGTYEPEDEDERTWHELSNGERIYGMAGNCYSWTFDDVQGDDNGIVASGFTADSASITSAPAPSLEKGVGWYPDASRNWSGDALVRGGCWVSSDDAGVFNLGVFRPEGESGYVGFRCTLP